MQKFVDNKEKVKVGRYKNEADWHIDEFYLRNSCLQIALHRVRFFLKSKPNEQKCEFFDRDAYPVLKFILD